MSSERIGALSVGQLKAALFAAHVRAPPQALEKAELVARVLVVLEDERRRREREAAAHAAEEEAARERARIAREEREAEERLREERRVEAERLLRERQQAAQARQEQEGVQVSARLDGETVLSTKDEQANDEAQVPPAAQPKPAPTFKSSPPPPLPERTGLCVICQDEEACIAIVDCGCVLFVVLLGIHALTIQLFYSHMAMCRGCADLIMASSRECPLCRTRIVTEARLLRIFKT
jgi:hypothetical protein